MILEQKNCLIHSSAYTQLQNARTKNEVLGSNPSCGANVFYILTEKLLFNLRFNVNIFFNKSKKSKQFFCEFKLIQRNLTSELIIVIKLKKNCN